MPGKPAKTKYGEFRHFVEWMRKGKWRIRRELLPPMAAWILMLARRYEKAADAMHHKFLTQGIPGMREAAQRMRFAVEHLRWLMEQLPQNFDHDDWCQGTYEVCKLMDIVAETPPIEAVPDDQFTGLITEPANADDASGVGTNLQHGMGDGAGGETPQRDTDPRRPKRTGKKGVPRPPRTRKVHVP